MAGHALGFPSRLNLRRLRRPWRMLAKRVAWTPPTSTELALVAKAGLAAALSWAIATVVTDVPDPVLAPLTALITIRVSVRASVRHAIQRSAAVVLGVLLAIGIGDTLGLNAVTVGLLTGGSLAITQLVLRLPRAAATQAPTSVLLVMAAVSGGQGSYGWQRVLTTVLGAGVGVAVSLALPASRLPDARQTIERLGNALQQVLEAMGSGVRRPWDASLTVEWRRTARVARDRLVDETREAVGDGREAAGWNLRDRGHVAELGRYDDVLAQLERTAIGVSVIARGLDDHAQLAGDGRPPMPEMARLLEAVARLVRAVVRDVLWGSAGDEEARALEQVRRWRSSCGRVAIAQARREVDGEVDGDGDDHGWMTYTALLVQIDRVVDDLRAPTPGSAPPRAAAARPPGNGARARPRQP